METSGGCAVLQITSNRKNVIVGIRAYAGLAGILLVASTGALGQDEGFRFFLDKQGVADNAARPANSPLQFTNPTVAGVGRFYLYVAYGTNNQHFYHAGLRVTISGNATFTGGSFYNHIAGDLNRWQPGPSNIAPTPGTTTWTIGWVKESWGYGARNNDGTGGNGPDTPGAFGLTQQADTHFRADDGSLFGTTLLGYFDVAHGGGDTATIKLGSGASMTDGSTIAGSDFVYFGFGDSGTTNGANRTSTLPDGYISVPEPVTLSVLAAAFVVRGVFSRRIRR